MNIRTTYSTKLRQALDELRPAFRELGQGLDQLTKKRAEIAPTFMRTYHVWKRETHKPFIAFVHELDPSVPAADRKAYRVHRSYRAAQYLQQLVEQPDKTAARGKTPLTMLALTIKSLLPFCGSEKDQEATIATLVHATKWRERDRNRLVTRILKARPIALPHLPRLVKPEAIKASKAAVIAFQRKNAAA
jgi:hypothetical protein